MKQAFNTAVRVALQNWPDLPPAHQAIFDQLALAKMASVTQRLSPETRLHQAVIQHGVELVRAQHPESADILTKRFLEQEIIRKVSLDLNLTDDQLKRRQRDAINQLTDYLWQAENEAKEARLNRLRERLPPLPPTPLFGVASLQESLLAMLKSSDNSQLVIVTGLGGIGKTVVSLDVAYTLINQNHFEDVAFFSLSRHATDPTSAKLIWENIALSLCDQLMPGHQLADIEERMSRLQQLLAQSPILILIDNLETEADVAMFTEQLLRLGGRGKFLVTSRIRPSARADVRSLALNELSFDASRQLIQHQGSLLGLNEIATISEDGIRPVYKAVGGNPLALKLVVGLANIFSLSDIVGDLRQAHTDEIARMYTQIYWKVWNSLSENGRSLLEMMPMAAGIGIKLENMKAISGLENNQLKAAVSELVRHSLLDVHGDAWERRYSIHPLTDSFLKTEIINWPLES